MLTNTHYGDQFFNDQLHFAYFETKTHPHIPGSIRFMQYIRPRDVFLKNAETFTVVLQWNIFKADVRIMLSYFNSHLKMFINHNMISVV